MLKNQRGQTMPFWLLATVMAVTMLLFAGNYETMIAWQIHAQNAADSATAIALSPTVNVLNEESTILYASAIAEYRLRYLNQGLLNAINHQGCSSNCAAVYAALLPAYDNALNSYDEAWQLLQRANNFTQGGQNADEKQALSALSNFDPAFTYTVLASPAPGKGKNASSVRTVDLVTCKTINYFGPGIFGITSPSYQVIGRSASSTKPVALASSGSYTESFSPSTINAATGLPYQPNEDPAGLNNALFTVDYTPLTVNLDWFSTAAIAPFAQGTGTGGSLAQGDYQC